MGPGGHLGSTGRDAPRGLTRRALLGAAATSVVASSAVARSLQRAGTESLDGVFLVVAQHELRNDRHRLRDLRSAQRAAGGTEPFVLVGITAPGVLPADEEHTAWIRTRGADGWSEWMPIGFSPLEWPDDAEAAGGPALASQPLWVGWSDAVEIDVPGAIDGSAEVHLLRETPVSWAGTATRRRRRPRTQRSPSSSPERRGTPCRTRAPRRSPTS